MRWVVAVGLVLLMSLVIGAVADVLVAGDASRPAAPARARVGLFREPSPPRRVQPPKIVRGVPAAPVPILMYHEIGFPPPSGAPYPELYVAPAIFRAQMTWLAAHGYQAVTLRRVYDYWTRGRALPPRAVVISFDDGYPSHVEVALPALRARRWPGVLNLHIGNLVPAQVRALISAGWEIDAHSFTHADLTTLDPHRLRREVRASRSWIRGIFHVRADFFCYPSGRYNAAVVAEVRRAGYLGATTTQEGFASPRDGLLTLKRIRVNGSDGVAGLAAKLRHSSGRPSPPRSNPSGAASSTPGQPHRHRTMHGPVHRRDQSVSRFPQQAIAFLS